MPADIEVLLAEAPWLARLARSLTGDAAEADEIVQETYAAALRSPPSTDRPVRPWLRRVAGNLARMRYRSGRRRAANESVVEAQLDPVRTPEELLERAELERRLAALVIELDEPFRTTVLLRYREGLSTEQIATQQGIPAATVRTRLKAAVDRLRRELDERDRVRMRAMFLPAPALGRLVMVKATSKIALVVLLLFALLIGVIAVSRRAEDAPRREVTTAPLEPTLERPAMFAQAGIERRRVRGRVTNDGAPYPGAIVQLVHAQTQLLLAEVKSAANGTFDLGERDADLYVVSASASERAALPLVVDLRKPADVIELRLEGCTHVRGTVVDGAGTPIVGARIRRDGVHTPVAETDAMGRYDLCTHFGAAVVRYSAAGFHAVLVDLDAAASITRDVVLIPEAIVEGKVVTVDNIPVSGAWVVVAPSDVGTDRNAPASAFAESDGTFRISGAAPGRNLIAAFAPGMLPTHKQELVLGAGQVTSGIIVRLERAATLRGVVVAGGVPVAGAGVGLRSGNRDDSGVLAVTQSDGSFVIDRAPQGEVGLYVVNHTVLAPRSIRAGESTSVVVEVERTATIRGRVMRDGEPVAGAQVSCPRTKVHTDGTGTYVCDDVDAGPKELFADLPSGAWGRASVTVERGATAQLDIPITFSAAICGQLVDDRRAPVPGLEVRVAERTDGDFGKDISAHDGTFCARILSGGTYDVALYAAGRLVEPITTVPPVRLGPNETKQLTITVAAPHQEMSGIVVDPHGAPVIDAIVRIAAADRMGAPNFHSRAPGSLTVTDDEGRFAFRGLAAGDYMFIATARDGSSVTTPATPAGSRDITITLAAAGRIEGTLVGFSSTPRITALLMSDTQVLVDTEVAAGRFRASGLSPGTYVLMALTDAREADTQKVVVHSGETTHVTLTSRGTATVTGVVRDFKTRSPIGGARCAAFARQGEAMGAIYTGPDEASVTDPRGAYRMVSPAGEINVACFGGGANGGTNATATRGATTTVDVLTVPIAANAGTIDADFDWLRPRIRELTKGGSAERAGLAVGDEIIAVDEHSVIDLSAGPTMRLITQRPTGSLVPLVIQRAGEQRRVVVTVRSVASYLSEQK